MNQQTKVIIIVVSLAVIISLLSSLMINGCVREGKEIMLDTKVNGLTVTYRRTGEDPALILLHAFTQDCLVWRQQLESLSENFTVIAWDAPGTGQSSDPLETFRDKRSPISVVYQIRDAIPGAKLIVITGAGHVNNLKKPARFNTILRNFFLSLSIR